MSSNLAISDFNVKFDKALLQTLFSMKGIVT